MDIDLYYNNKDILSSMSVFFMCPEFKCNRKYKTSKKLVKHLLIDHESEVVDISPNLQVAITKQNKKTKEKEKDAEYFRQQQEQARQQSQRIKDLEKLVLQNKKQQAEPEQEQESKSGNQEASGPECAICFDAKSSAAVVPCGHANFCFPCLKNYRETNASKGCPVCRGPIQTIVNLYM